jgi:hypothetical protein
MDDGVVKVVRFLSTFGRSEIYGNTSSNGREMKRHWQNYSAKDSNTVLPKGGYVRLLASSGKKELDIIYARLGFVRESSC